LKYAARTSAETDMARLFRKCGARIKRPWRDMPNGTTKYRQPTCQLRPMPGKTRCRFHGGKSTGPVTAEGMAAVVEGRRRWVERMKAEGRKLPSGRKPGAAWITPRMRQKREIEASEHATKVEAESPAAMSPFERQIEEGRRALDKLKAHFERRRWLDERLPQLLAKLKEEKKRVAARERATGETG
jgi:hypothetical protein